jgi:hypothetical protein
MTDKKVNLQALFDEETTKHILTYKLSGQEGRQRMREAKLGKSLSEETRSKLRENHIGFTGKQHSEETRATLSTLAKARERTPLTEEHKQKQSEGAKKRWATNPYKPTAEVIEKRRQATLKTNAEKRAAMPPKVVEPTKKRGRPKTRPELDPNAPKKRRGRPPKVSSH